jgi:hypothetical protein
MNEPKMIRQGDVLLRPVPDQTMNISPRPARVKPEQGLLILAKGEATGHHHAVAESDAELVRQGEKLLLWVEQSARLTHQEHREIELPGGLYEVIPQREFVPAPAGMPSTRRVHD